MMLLGAIRFLENVEIQEKKDKSTPGEVLFSYKSGEFNWIEFLLEDSPGKNSSLADLVRSTASCSYRLGLQT